MTPSLLKYLIGRCLLVFPRGLIRRTRDLAWRFSDETTPRSEGFHLQNTFSMALHFPRPRVQLSWQKRACHSHVLHRVVASRQMGQRVHGPTNGDTWIPWSEMFSTPDFYTIGDTWKLFVIPLVDLILAQSNQLMIPLIWSQHLIKKKCFGEY